MPAAWPPAQTSSRRETGEARARHSRKTRGLLAASATTLRGRERHPCTAAHAHRGRGLRLGQLLWVSRLLRNRPAYENRFGTGAYEVMLADSLWGVYQMIGKLNPRIYVLSR